MAGTVVHPAVIIAVQCLAHQGKFRLDAVGQAAQLCQEIQIQAIGNVQTQAIDIIVPYPAAYRVKQVFLHRRVAQVQFHQLIAAFPCFVPEAVIITGVAVKADMEPVFIGAVPLFLLHIAERPESAAHMVEHAVQHNADAGFMQGFADSLEILFGPKARINAIIIAGVIAVGIAVKQRIKQHTGCAQFFYMFHPVQHAQNTVFPGLVAAIVLQRSIAQAQGIDLVDCCIIKPHNFYSSILFFLLAMPRNSTCQYNE